MNNKTMNFEIMVFATGVKTIKLANELLERILLHKGVKQANFDLEDRDRILRVVSDGVTEREIENILADKRMWCRVLV